MDDRELDEAVAAVVVSDAHVAALDLAGTDTELREALMTTAVPTPLVRRPSSRLRAAAAVAALVAALVVAPPLGPDREERTPPVAQRSVGAASEEPPAADPPVLYPEPVLAVARSAPRYLLDGWSVADAAEFGADQGEMELTDGQRALVLRWYPGDEFEDFVVDRDANATELDGVLIDGETARVFVYDPYAGVDGFFMALWRHGGHALEARGEFAGAGDFAAVVTALEEVEVEPWLAAMPDSVVRPADRDDTIASMLTGIPLPPGFDPAVVEDPGGVPDRYQLGARVTAAVACGWIEEWIAARARGDEQRAQSAVDALATSRDWPILLEMDAEGDYPEGIWEYADAVAGDGLIHSERVRPVEESYAEAFGCDDPGRS